MPKTKKREMPKAGSVFEKQYLGKTHKLKVVKSPTGVAFEYNGRVFRTPTAAAKSIVNHEVNGWTFWKMDAIPYSTAK
jgi:hypothetical protein